MLKIKIDLPRVAVSMALVNGYIKAYNDVFTGKHDIVVLINGHNCEITTTHFVDYFRSELKRFDTIKQIIVSQGPPQLLQIGESMTYTGLDFTAMVDTLNKNIQRIEEHEGVYVSVTYEVKDIELLAIALLERGFRLETAEIES